MYAIFMTGGKQYKVSAGDVLRIEKIEGGEGDQVKFENVLAFSDDKGEFRTGTPYLDAATVNATITEIGKGKKVIVFKYKAKKNYRRKKGHRQPFTEIEVDNFTIDGETVGEKPEKPVVEEPEEAEETTEAEAKDKKPRRGFRRSKAEAEEAPEEEAKAKKPLKKKDSKKDEAESEAASDEVDVDTEAEDADLVEIETESEKIEAEAEDEAEPEADEVDETEAEADVEEKPAEVKKDVSKLTKAEITAKLDELGVEYAKSAKKDELLALLEGAENK